MGGILGGAYFTGGTQYASFWGNMIAKGLPTTFAIHLLPSQSDWGWIPNAPSNLSAYGGSVLQAGNYNS